MLDYVMLHCCDVVCWGASSIMGCMHTLPVPYLKMHTGRQGIEDPICAVQAAPGSTARSHSTKKGNTGRKRKGGRGSDVEDDEDDDEEHDEDYTARKPPKAKRRLEPVLHG